jgi:hypothetical protein
VTTSSQNFRAFAGDTCTLDITLTNPDGTIFNPAEAGSYVWIATRDPTNYDAAAIIKTSLDNGGITTISGGIAVTLSNTDTDLPAGPYAHLLRVWDGTRLQFNPARVLRRLHLFRRRCHHGRWPDDHGAGHADGNIGVCRMGKTRKFQAKLHVARPGQSVLLDLPKGKRKVRWAGDFHLDKRGILRLAKRAEKQR